MCSCGTAGTPAEEMMVAHGGYCVPCLRPLRMPLERALLRRTSAAAYLLPHQLNMPPTRPPVLNALFCCASKVS